MSAAADRPTGESVRIRRLGPGDAAALSALARATFVETFGHLYPPEDLAAFLDDAYSEDRHRVMLSDPRYAAWFLEDGGVPVGHALAGACGLPHDDVGEHDGELKRLYLLASHQNGGHGGRLFATVMDWLERDGPRTLWIGVWSENAGAQRFYLRQGFERVGTYEFPVGRVRDLEYILRRPARQAGDAAARAS